MLDCLLPLQALANLGPAVWLLQGVGAARLLASGAFALRGMVPGFADPDTVESRIWEKLNAKIEQITRALGRVMAHPEDLLQLVLGMSSPAVFREIFADASDV